MQHRLKASCRTTGTRVVAAEPLDQLLVAVHHAVTALDPSFAEGTPCGACSSVQNHSSSSLSMAGPPREAPERKAPHVRERRDFRWLSGATAISFRSFR